MKNTKPEATAYFNFRLMEARLAEFERNIIRLSMIILPPVISVFLSAVDLLSHPSKQMTFVIKVSERLQQLQRQASIVISGFVYGFIYPQDADKKSEFEMVTINNRR